MADLLGRCLVLWVLLSLKPRELAEQPSGFVGLCANSIEPGYALASPVWRAVACPVLGLCPGVCLQPQVMIHGARPRGTSRLQRTQDGLFI